mgnify:CR=1 FL=1
MIDGASSIGLLLALSLPWFTGAAWTRALLAGSGRHNLPLVLGYGYFLGLLLVTSLIHVWHWLDIDFHFSAIAIIVALLALPALALCRLRPDAPVQGSGEYQWRLGPVLLVAFLLALILWRQFALLEELLLRPLFAWDAWMNWAPRAIVWFHHGELVEFVHPQTWMKHPGETLYTLGNRQASNYPPMIPLMLLWSMLGAGTWDGGALYLPWLLAPLCFCMAMFGHLRLAGVSPLLATLACYLLLSLPYLNVHTMLAGYADLWLALAFGLAVCALYEWRSTRRACWALLALLLALMCTQLKVPGYFLALIILLGVVRTWLNLAPRTELLLVLGGCAVLALLLGDGVTFSLPGLGRFSFAWGQIEVGPLGQFILEYHPVGWVMGETFLHMINWHLLGVLVPLLLVNALCRGHLFHHPPTEVLVVAAALVFILFVFFLTGYHSQAENYVAINRVLLYLMPALVFTSFLYLHGRVLDAGLRVQTQVP